MVIPFSAINPKIWHMTLKRPELVIADTNCLILLDKISELEILPKLYTLVYTTSTIADGLGINLPLWVIIRNPVVVPPYGIKIDKGEAAAIAPALEIPNTTLVIDDIKGRKVAKQLKLNYTGGIGGLKRAKAEGLFPSLKIILDKVQQTNFRLTQTLIDFTLKEFGEA